MNGLLSSIEKKYTNETGAENLGCANLFPYLDIHEGYYVLDLGCGSGSQTVKLAEKAGFTGFTAGIDLTSSMIGQAKLRQSAYPVDFRVGDIHGLPYPGDYFDLVVSNCVINHSPDKGRVYAEIFRVLKPGGTFVIGDVMAQEKLPLSVSNDPEAVAACWGGAIPGEDYIRMIGQCGFQDLKILNNRRYTKNGYGLESIVIRGVKQ